MYKEVAGVHTTMFHCVNLLSPSRGKGSGLWFYCTVRYRFM